jgi:hypothetical protein
MGFKPDPVQSAASTGRFRPESPAAAGADDILGNARMKELSNGTAAPIKPLDVAPATTEDRVQAAASGGNMGLAGLTGMATDTALNVWDLAKAGAGFVQGEVTGKAPSPMFDPSDRSQYFASTESVANAANDVGIQTQANRPDDLASRLIHGAATGVPSALAGGGGAPNMVKQGVAGVVAGLGGEASGELGADEGQQSVIANALGLAAGHQLSKPTQPKPVVKAEVQPSEGRAQLAEIRKQGIKVTPKEASRLTGDKNFVGRTLQAIGGDAKVSKDISAANRPVLNDMASKAVGADSITGKGLKPVKDAGNAVYNEMASLGKVTPTPELTKAIESARGTAGKSTKRNVDVDKFVDGVLAEFGGEATADQIVTRVRELRRDASNNLIGEGDKRPTIQQEALGASQRQVADALDDFLEYNASLAGKPELAEKYKENRTRLAKAGTVEGASRAGNINAKTLYDQKQKGAPMTGKLAQIADAHEWVPESTAPNAGETLLDAPGRNVDILELPVMAAQAAARHMGVNKLLQSDWYQNMIGGKAGDPHMPEHVTPEESPFPPRVMPPEPPVLTDALPQVAPEFAGPLGLAPDGPYQTLPGGNMPAPVNGRSFADELGLSLVEDSTPAGVGPNALRNGPDEINYEPVSPAEAGPYRLNTDPQLSDARPLAGVQRGRAVHDSGNLELAPDQPTGPQDKLPPSPGKPRQGGAPKLPATPKAKVAAPVAETPPEGLGELGALIDEMLRTKNPRAVQTPQWEPAPQTSTRNMTNEEVNAMIAEMHNGKRQMENPVQQQQAQAQARVPETNFAQELMLELEDLAARQPKAANSSRVQNNASGESSASVEAMNRVASEKAAGQNRYLIDRDGTVTPIIGVDGVDAVAKPGQVIVQRGVGADPYTILDRGGLSQSAAKGRIAGAHEQLTASEVPSKLPKGQTEKVTAYRGVRPGRDPLNTTDSIGGALHFTPDKSRATQYARGGSVAEQNLEFNNLLKQPKWSDVVSALGLEVDFKKMRSSDVTKEVIRKAHEAGYDGISYDTATGTEYVKLPPRKPKT